MTGNDLTEAPGLDRIIRDLRAAVRLVHPGNLNANEAAKLVTAFAEAERLCVAGRTFAARSVERSAVCCDSRERLEIDHVIPLAEGGPTNLENLQRLCPWHHYLKTHHGYQLDSVGEQQSTGPDPPIQ